LLGGGITIAAIKGLFMMTGNPVGLIIVINLLARLTVLAFGVLAR
jgi:hypothetical protein